MCAVCWTSVPPDFSLCFQCDAARKGFRQGLADAVVPIALAVKREQLAHELWHYKYDVDPSVRSRLTTRLGAVLWRFLGQHEKHIAEGVGAPEFGVVTTVPGTSQREGSHPLEYVVGTLVGQTKDRYQPLLSLGQGRAASSHSLMADRYAATQRLAGGSAVLLIDDTWTTGGNAQSAALALRSAGASKVAIVVIGRHFDRSFRDCETYYRQARSIRFTWDTCCLEFSAAELLVIRATIPMRCPDSCLHLHSLGCYFSGSRCNGHLRCRLCLRIRSTSGIRQARRFAWGTGIPCRMGRGVTAVAAWIPAR